MGSRSNLLAQPLAALAWCFIELLAVPAAEGAQRGIAEEVGDVGQSLPAMREVAVDLANPDSVEHLAEGHVFLGQSPLEGPDIEAQAVRHRADRGPASRHEHQNSFFDFFYDAAFAGVDDRFDQPSRMQCQRGLRSRVGSRQVGALDQYSVEFRAEFQGAGKEALVHRTIGGGRSFVAETDADRLPTGTDDTSANPVKHRNG